MDRNSDINIVNKKNKNKKGFTLIELIVVVLILGIVAGVAVPKITVIMDEAKEATLYTNLHNLRLAAMTAVAEDPSLKTRNPDISLATDIKKVANKIGDILGQPVETKAADQPYFSNITIPEASYWHLQRRNPHGIYLHVQAMDEIAIPFET